MAAPRGLGHFSTVKSPTDRRPLSRPKTRNCKAPYPAGSPDAVECTVRAAFGNADISLCFSRFSASGAGNAADAVARYGEAEALKGSLGAMKGGELMDLLLK